ncbi:MAG: YHS domain-containing (seleno)protein [Motiliproteus sp.]
MYKKFIFIGVLILSRLAIAEQPVSTGYLTNTAIGGHDSVSYHTQKSDPKRASAQGDQRFKVQWKGADWFFATQASADKFAADPERYRPEYNGHCSNALSLGEGLISTDGTVWEFFGDKLHLFYADGGGNAG